MNVLVLGPESPEARFNDLDYALMFERYGASLVHRRDPSRLYEERGMEGMEAEIANVVRHQGITALVHALGIEFNFRPGFLAEDLAHVYRVLILGDEELYFDVSHRYYAQCFDLVLSNNPLVERFYLYGMDALFLPNVFDPEVFCPTGQAAKTIDVSFVGAMQGQIGREEYREALARAGIDPYLRGQGTRNGPIAPAEVINTYRRSRVNLNFTGVVPHTPLTAGLSITRRVRQVKGRCTKIALCGSFVLSEYAPGIEKLFDVGTEIDVFHDAEELVEKTRFYLAHEDRREEMAARAHTRALQQYDAAKFWPEMVRAIRARSETKRRAADYQPAYFDKPFWSAFGAWRFKYLVVFLFAGKPGLFLKELALLLHTGRFNAAAALSFVGIGLHIARQRSRPAAWVAAAARSLRHVLKGGR